MRTTLTLDDDVAAILERLRKSRDASLKDLVNEALRRGLKDMTNRTKRHERLQTRSVALGRLRIAISTTLAKPSPLPRAKATSDIGRRQYSHLRHVSSFAQHSP